MNDGDGFEANPQTFRIVTKLAVRDEMDLGLNLTRATLNAILKYPWFRQDSGFKNRKWGAYRTEKKEFKWSRELYPRDERKSAEAELMDLADDIAFATHDVEDFYRAGLIPLDKLVKDSEELYIQLKKLKSSFSLDPLVKVENELALFFDGVFKRWEKENIEIRYDKLDLMRVFTELIYFFPINFTKYTGTRIHRANLRNLTSGLIRRYIYAIELQVPTNNSEPRVKINPEREMEIIMLKQLTWHYVISSPSLSTLHYGQKCMIRELFDIFCKAARSSDYRIFPFSSREQLENLDNKISTKNTNQNFEEEIRIIADMIASLTEQQVINLYQRLTGTSLGSVLDTILR